MDYKKIERARKILNLPEKASISSIKKAYYELTKKYHPDKCEEKSNNSKICKEKMQEIAEAYKILIKYCENYPISFKSEDIKKGEPEFDYLKKFYPDFI